ncbi:MAG: hypothetical protein ACTHMM_05520 [Agriterribacter sp.]
MKNNISYYPHKTGSHNHWKFKVLRKRYGWAGEGKFWALNNMIADAEWCMLDLSDEGRKMAVATDLDFDPKGLDEFIQYLIHVSKLVIDKDGSISTTIVQETLAEVDSKREYQRNWKRSISNSNNQISNSKPSDSNIDFEQSKVNKSKVNKNKEDIGAPSAPTAPTDIPKKTRKKFVPPTLPEVEKYFLSTVGDPKQPNAWREDKCINQAAQCFDHYVANGWVQNKGKPIVNWQAAIRNWIRNELNGTYAPKQRAEPPPKKNEPPPAPAATPELQQVTPQIPKIAAEINYLFERFLEVEDHVTIISVEAGHYDYLKKAGRINWTTEQTTVIRKKATDHIAEKNLETDEKNVVRFMKLFGVVEFFQQQKNKGDEKIFDEKDFANTAAFRAQVPVLYRY